MQELKFSLLFLLVINGFLANLVVGQDQNYTTVINAGNGLNRGEWGPIALCPPGSFAGQMEFKYEPWGSTDVTNGNSVKLYCYNSDYALTGYVTSTEGKQGSWQGIQSCPQGVFIVGYAMEVLPNQGVLGDDVGVQNVRATCEDGTLLYGIPPTTQKELPSEHVVVENGNKKQPFRNLRYTLTDEDRKKFNNNEKFHLRPEAQEFGAYAGCPTGTLVCGLQTEVEDANLETDDAGLCNLLFFCCNK